MVSFWPTPAAAQQLPAVVARQMNELPKIVFSRTLTTSPWQNTTVASGDLVAAVQRLKAEGRGRPHHPRLGQRRRAAGEGRARRRIPAARGAGRARRRARRCSTACEPARSWLATSTRTFKNGNVYTVYEPAPRERGRGTHDRRRRARHDRLRAHAASRDRARVGRDHHARGAARVALVTYGDDRRARRRHDRDGLGPRAVPLDGQDPALGAAARLRVRVEDRAGARDAARRACGVLLRARAAATRPRG